MFLYFFSLAIIAFEVICCKLFFESFCDTPKTGNKHKNIILLFVLILIFFVCGLTLSKWIIFKQLCAIISTAVVMHFYFNIGIKKSMVLAVLYQGLLMLVDYLAYVGNSAIISREGVVAHEYELEGNLVVIFSKVIAFLCIILIRKQFGKKSTEVLADAEWIKFLFFPIFTIIVIFALLMTFQYTENENQANALYSIAFGMVVMNVFVYYLINDIVIREAKLHEKEILELQVKNQVQMYRSISENLDKQKRKSHEFKNQILCIESLLKDKEYDNAVGYVGKISDSFSKEKNAINTNHVIINAILNTKYEEAINKHIVFVFKVDDLSKIKIEDEDLVVILANLLNNAIEACEKCIDKKIIKFKFVIEDEMMILSVKNTYNQQIKFDNNEIKTTKIVEPDEHGVGIKNIVRIVEKYGGEYVIQNDEDEFYFSIIMPMFLN